MEAVLMLRKRLVQIPADKRVFFAGGRRNVFADKTVMAENPKRVRSVAGTYLPSGLSLFKGSKKSAAGRHGKAYDLVVFKGWHKVNLVVKKYNLKHFRRTCSYLNKQFREAQGSIAKKEFKIFKNLKQAGFAVPPTVRLVEIGREKYVALTDLSKLGDVQTKELDALWHLGIPKAESERIRNYVERETARAKRLGWDIRDSWEYVIATDSNKKTGKAFILDLGFALEDAILKEAQNRRKN